MTKATDKADLKPADTAKAGDAAPTTSTTAAAADTGGESPGDPMPTIDPKPAEKPTRTVVAKTEKPVILNECEVQIERNEVTKISATVYEHEVPILRQVHGEDRIKVLDTYEVELVGFKVRDEFERLKRRYNNKQVGDVVVKAYPMGYLQLADELGIAPERTTEPKAAKVASQNEGSARVKSRTVK
jgi:hypothetical protein